MNTQGLIKCLVAHISLCLVAVSCPLAASNFTYVATYRMASRSLIAVGDLNGDGKADLIIGGCGDISPQLQACYPWSSYSGLTVLLGKGDGTFSQAGTYYAGAIPSDITVGDVNSDGKPDLIVGNYSSSGDLTVLLGNGDGTFGSPISYSPGVTFRGVAVADLNCDGRLDVVLMSYDRLTVLLGNGDGTFQNAFSFVGSWPVLPYGDVSPVIVRDVNNDGYLDLVTTGMVVLGNGDGTFQQPLTFSLPTEPGNGFIIVPNFISHALLADDFDHDGKVDIIAGWQWSYAMGGPAFLKGNGDGTFQPAVYPVEMGAIDSVIAGHFSSADDLDLIISGRNPDKNLLQVLVDFDGTSALGNERPYDYFYWPNGTAAGDFNGDGAPDLAILGEEAYLGELVPGYFVNIFLNEVVPSVKVQPDQTVECAGPSGTTVQLNSSASDPQGLGLNLAWTDDNGRLLGTGASLNVVAPLGTNSYHFRATNSAGFSATATAHITVVDSTPPVVSLSLTPTVLWPPSGQLISVAARLLEADLCDPAPIVNLASVTANEPLASGDVVGALTGTDDRSFLLRAYRLGSGTGRVYTVVYQVQDHSGNTTSRTATVTVPHDQAQ